MHTKDIKFDTLAPSYDTGWAGRFSQRFYNLLLSVIELDPGAKVLDVGCGTGALLQRIAEQTPICGYGIDTEEMMLVEARKKLPDMTFVKARSERIPYPDATFDVVVACMAFHHFTNTKAFAAEASRVLRPGGCVYIVDPYLPPALRRVINLIIRSLGLTGKFFTSMGMHRIFREHDVYVETVEIDGYAQAVCLIKAGVDFDA